MSVVWPRFNIIILLKDTYLLPELTQMYPTPPSQEPQHTLSPGNMTELPPDQTMLDISTTKLDSVSHMIEEHKVSMSIVMVLILLFVQHFVYSGYN